MVDKHIFHVHTFRCGHASAEPDEDYIKKAIELGAERITFTDHAPFPENVFLSRMKYEELPEYISTLKKLKKQYQSLIDVSIGLEVEYIPEYDSYYHCLADSKNYDVLMIGQHFFRQRNGNYSFTDTSNATTEMAGLAAAMIHGMDTGLFRVVAHPDRIFRRCPVWESEMKYISEEIIETAVRNDVLLEQNVASMQHKNYYWTEFWDMTPKENIIIGFDAHSVEELSAFWEMNKSFL